MRYFIVPAKWRETMKGQKIIVMKKDCWKLYGLNDCLAQVPNAIAYPSDLRQWD